MGIFQNIAKVFGDPNTKELEKIKPLIEKINELEDKFRGLSDEEIKSETENFRKRLKKGTTLDEVLPEAFANCREAGRRVIGQRAFDSQLIGGVALHRGKITEMKTGEGKTLAAVFAVYLNALERKGAHVITVNDYLARRDTNWMGSIYAFLGLSIGCIQHETAYLFDPQVEPDENEVSIEYENLRQVSRGEAYKADITYGTNNEFGFDYLRDNMVLEIGQMVQVKNVEALIKEEQEKKKISDRLDEKKIFKKGYLNFAVVDEVDSILIDEARTPLIISAPDIESTKLYQKFAKIVPKLVSNKDYNVDEKMQAVTLTERGINRVEKMLGVTNIYASGQMNLVHHLHQALKAQAIFKKDKEYMVRDDEVVIVDDFTGRLMPGRRFSEGLHQALEAKEGVKIQKESKTLATITFQNYFRLYKKLSGMTGTALTSAEEFFKVYELDVLSIPTNKKMIRADGADIVYKNEHGKFNAIAEDIKRRNKKGQPVLVGTISVEKSEKLSQYLEKKGVSYEILNAKNHEREAQIIAGAGQLKAVTIATNMAGRGTDIKLGKGVVEAGGLHVIGTERHEARRIDNQLRGRAGRQGDPGSSRFFVSLEDELMRRFGSDKIKNIMDTLGLPEDQPIENKMISRSIESAQKKIEGYNFDIRKHVLEYDDVVNRQRETIYQKRRQILLGIVDKKEVEEMIGKLVENFVSFHTQGEEVEEWNKKEIFEYSQSLFSAPEELNEELEEIIASQNLDVSQKKEQLIKKVTKFALASYGEKEEEIGANILRQLERIVMLRTLDTLWMEHLDNMQYLREAVGLRGYGQRDPLVEYKKEGFEMFRSLLNSIRLGTIESLFKASARPKEEVDLPLGEPPSGRASLGGSRFAEKENSNLQLKGADSSQIGSFGNSDANPNEEQNASGSATVSSSPIKVQKKVGRNEPCPCGSEKKYKRCCGK